ncbi:sigma-54-dependent Fis family transcriptional regulator [Treponema phagedenis]|nr:sigma-54-dependent Fis family transcriptional regulator [Treponema phagedenis]
MKFLFFLLSRAYELPFERRLPHKNIRTGFRIPYLFNDLYKKIVRHKNNYNSFFIKKLDSSIDKEISELLWGISLNIQKLKYDIFLAAQSSHAVLLQGETGTGKEIVAKLIHEFSNRKNFSFIPVDSGSIHLDLAESILFGTEKGSFTGAESKIGLFSAANKGTLFLDEVENMSLDLQMKFLRVLDSKTFYPLGSTTSKHSEFRLISASNKNLKKMALEGKFREDLYYRIDVIRIEIPPLRERKEDIMVVAEKYIKNQHKTLSLKAVKKLEKYNWPGNIRELFNCLDRAAWATGDNPVIDESAILF